MKVLDNTRFEVQFEATLWGTIKELREVIALAESGHSHPFRPSSRRSTGPTTCTRVSSAARYPVAQPLRLSCDAFGASGLGHLRRRSQSGAAELGEAQP